MGGSHLSGPLYVGGVPVGGSGIPATKGTVYYVDYGSGNDGNTGLTMEQAFKTVLFAYNKTTTNKDDVIALIGNSAHTLSAMLTVSKSRVHFVGVDGTGGRMIQQNARLVMGVTGVASDLAPVLVTGTRNSFANIKAENASTTNESLYGWIENGEGTYYENFMSCKTAGLNDANHAHFWLAGDACSGRNLTFGHSTVVSTAAGFGLLIDGKSGGGSSVVKELMWENVRVNMSVATGVVGTSAMIKIADTAAMNFVNTIDNFRGYHFISVGQTILTDAVLAPASIVSGTLFLPNSTFMGCTGVIDNPSAGVQTAAGGLAPDGNGGLATNLSDA